MDSLTGCYNRTKLEDIRSEIENSSDVIEFTYYSIDANNLKLLNDKFGHETGDLLIKITGSCGQKVWGDNVFHSGGDEFAVLIRGIQQSSDEMLADIAKFKQLVAEEDSKYPEYPLSVAVGAATGDTKNKTFKMVLDEADEFMMRDKEAYKKAHPEYDMRKARLDKNSLKEVMPVVTEHAEKVVKNVLADTDDKIKSEVKEEIGNSLSRYERRRRRREVSSLVLNLSKVVFIILLILTLLGNTGVRQRVVVTIKDIGAFVTNMINGDGNISSNKLIDDVVEGVIYGSGQNKK